MNFVSKEARSGSRHHGQLRVKSPRSPSRRVLLRLITFVQWIFVIEIMTLGLEAGIAKNQCFAFAQNRYCRPPETLGGVVSRFQMGWGKRQIALQLGVAETLQLTDEHLSSPRRCSGGRHTSIVAG
jgi:hypothetical protein